MNEIILDRQYYKSGTCEYFTFPGNLISFQPVYTSNFAFPKGDKYLKLTKKLSVNNITFFPYRTGILPIWIILLLCASGYSAEDTRLKIINAGSLEKMEKDGESVQQFTDDVILQRGSMTLYTDKAIHYPKRNEYHLLGSVKLIDEQDTLLSKTMVFYSDSNSYLRANDDIYYRQGDQIITCDSLHYWTEIDSGVAMGNVFMKTDRETMSSPVFHYWKTTGYRGTSFYTNGGTELIETDRQLLAESITYDDVNQAMTLTSNCHLTEPDKGISGDAIMVQYADSVIHSVEVTGSANAYQDLYAALYPEDPVLHQFRDNMSAANMRAFFQNGKMSELQLMGMAITEYNVVRDTLFNGVNTASGDTISVSFKDEQINRLQVFGGGRGVFEPEGNNTTIDSTITYQAEYIDYHVNEQITFLETDASVDYQGSQLMAGYIKSDWNTDMLIAELRGDTYPTITSITADPMSGEFMEFNLTTHHGRVVLGETKFNSGYYYGKEVYRDDPNVFHMQSSGYTTCDLDTPHFYLGSRKMKMVTGDKVIAKPIILYIYELPVFAIPLAVFPNKGGNRHSGWIMPSFGHRPSSGTYFQGLGYYWAPNDYLDGKLLLNFYDEKGFDVNGMFRYIKRYRYNGNLNTQIFNTIYSKEIADLFSPNVRKEWKIKWKHNQTIDPTQKLNISANYMSDNNINQNQGHDVNARLNQRLISNANYSKSWSGTKNSISMSISEDYDLLAVENQPIEKSKSVGEKLIERTRVVPAISFNHGQSQVFGNGPKWFNSIYWGMSSYFKAQQNVSLVAETDSTWSDGRDYDVRYTTRHKFTLTSPQKFLGWLTMNPVVNFNEDWVYKYREAQLDSDGAFLKNSSGAVEYNELEKFRPRHTFSLSVSANTKIYGTFPVRLGRLDALRHVMTPTIGFSWHPDFSKNVFGADPGYFQKDINGELYDRFNGSTAGNTSRNESKSISFSLNNEFQYKYLLGENSYSKETFLTWNMSTGYNATADSLKFSPINSSIRVLIPGGLDMDVSMSHNLYKLVPDSNGMLRTIDEFAPFPRLTSVSMGTSIRLKGKRFGSDETTTALPDTITADNLLPDNLFGGVSFDRPLPVMSQSELWNVGFNFRYTLNRRVMGVQEETEKNFNMGTTLTLNFTQNWRLVYNNSINLMDHKLVSHSFYFERPLHCWKFQFQWRPSGGNKGFMLKINVINPDLQDIRLKTQSGKLWQY